MRLDRLREGGQLDKFMALVAGQELFVVFGTRFNMQFLCRSEWLDGKRSVSLVLVQVSQLEVILRVYRCINIDIKAMDWLDAYSIAFMNKASSRLTSGTVKNG
jgi:hypothetical protein